MFLLEVMRLSQDTTEPPSSCVMKPVSISVPETLAASRFGSTHQSASTLKPTHPNTLRPHRHRSSFSCTSSRTHALLERIISVTLLEISCSIDISTGTKGVHHSKGKQGSKSRPNGTICTRRDQGDGMLPSNI